MTPKVPRDLSGADLCKLLKKLGYEVVRQTGSHIRLTAKHEGQEHHLTVPAHNPLKVGTLAAILSDVSASLRMERRILEQKLFG